MKKNWNYKLWLLCAVFAAGCSEQADLDEVFANRPFALVTAPDGDRTTISAEIDDSERSIALTFHKLQNLTEVALTFQLNPGYAMVSPSQTEATLDLTQPCTVRVRSGSGELSYALTARNETPLLAVSCTFRDERIEALIDPETQTIRFPIRCIYASEYPSELLSEVALEITCSEGYELLKEQAYFDLCGGEITLWKGRDTYTYTLVAEVEPLPVKDHLSSFRFRRGVNLAYWMTEADRDWLEYVTLTHFPMWKELGFDHFRVPVEERCIFNEDGSFNEKAVKKLHELFTWCGENGMYAILDMHTLAPREGTDSYREEELYDPAYPEFRAHFVDLWRRLAAEFRTQSLDHLAFELLNEPHDGTSDASAWNRLQTEVLTAIREQDPERIVLVPAMSWQDPTYIRYASVTEGDPNALVSFHYYLPMLLSHYKMLAFSDYQGGINYPGIVMPSAQDAIDYPKYAGNHTTTYNATRILGEITQAATDGRNIGRMVHCGEFGCSKNVPESMRLEWFADLVMALETNNVPWTLWECLDGGFGFIDMEDGIYRINCLLLRILTGKELTESEAKALLAKYGFKSE